MAAAAPSLREPLTTCRSAEKLLDGEKVFGFAMEKLDVELYLEARKHYDYIWFEMQHATLTYADGKTSGSPSAPSSEASKKRPQTTVRTPCWTATATARRARRS